MLSNISNSFNNSKSSVTNSSSQYIIFENDINMRINDMNYKEVMKITIETKLETVKPEIVYEQLDIIIDGDCGDISLTTGNVTVNNGCGNIKTLSGNVTIQNNGGDRSNLSLINTLSGDVTIYGNCSGKINTMSGDIKTNK